MMDAERALDALGDPTRRQVFKRVRDGSRSVQEFAQGMHVSRPVVSQHLKVLKAAGLVVVRAEGTRRLYAVDTRGVEARAALAAGASRAQLEDALAVCFAFNTINRLADAFGFDVPGSEAFDSGAKYLLARGYR